MDDYGWYFVCGNAVVPECDAGGRFSRTLRLPKRPESVNYSDMFSCMLNRTPARLVFCALLAAHLLVGSDRCSGGEERPAVELSRFPFSNRVPNRCWCPLLVRVNNPTGKVLELGVAAGFSLGLGDEAVFTRRVTLPACGTREVEMFVLVDYPPAKLRSLFNESEIALNFSDGTKRTASRRASKLLYFDVNLVNAQTQDVYCTDSLMGGSFYPGAFAVLVGDGIKPGFKTGLNYDEGGLSFALGEVKDDYDYWSGGNEYPSSGAFTLRNEPAPEDLGRDTEVNRLQEISMLPGKWAAYEGANALVLGSLDRGGGRRPSQQQQQSLLRYVQSGGKVVLMPASDPESYADPFWRELLPVRIVGARPAQGELAELERRYGAKIFRRSDRPPLMIEALPKDGETVIGSGGLVLLARKAVGSGEVWFCALSGEALEDWSAGHAFFADILRPRPSPTPGLNGAFAEGAGGFLQNIVGLETPGSGAITALLLTYLGLTGACVVLFRLKGRQELAWPCMLALALLAAAGTAALAAATRGGIGYVRGEIAVSVLRPGMSKASSTSYVGLFSPERARGTIVWDSPDTLATGYADWDKEGGQKQTVGVDEGLRFVCRDRQLDPGEMYMFRTMTMSDFGEGVKVNFRYGEQGFAGEVENRTGRDLKDCLLRVNRVSLLLGDIPAGGKADLAAGKLSAAFSSGGPAVAARREALARLLSTSDTSTGYQFSRIYEWPATFYGWCDQPAARLSIEGKRIRESNLHLLVVPAAPARGSGRVKLPFGACGLELLRGGNRMAFGNPPPEFGKYDRVQLPQEKQLIGSSPHPAAQSRSRLTPGGGSGAPGEGEDALPPVKRGQDDRFVMTGWQPQLGLMSVRVRFLPPPELAGLRVTRLTLRCRADLTGLEAGVGVARPGKEQADFPPELRLSGGKCEKVFSGAELKKYLGERGELPEFAFRPAPAAPQGGIAEQNWLMREFEVEIEGEVGGK